MRESTRTPDWQSIRERFPALETSTYLNTAGGGPLGREAFEAVTSYYDVAYRLGDTKWDEWLEKVERARERVAAALSVTASEVAFLANASQAMNTVCDLLATAEGRVVLIADDFPSVTLPWLARKRDITFLEPATSGLVDTDAVSRAIDGDTGILAVGLVHYVTGYRFSLAELARLCAESDVRLVVDATQAFGTFPIDASLVDALFFSGYKWATAGYGIAPLIVKRKRLRDGSVSSVGWRSARDPYAMKSRTLDRTLEARGLELGHPPFAGVLALDGSLDVVEQVGLEAIESRIGDLVGRLHVGLKGIGVEVLSPQNREERAGIVFVRVDEPSRIAARLKERGVFVSARGPGLRVSVHYYNNEEDIDRFLEELPRAIAPS